MMDGITSRLRFVREGVSRLAVGNRKGPRPAAGLTPDVGLVDSEGNPLLEGTSDEEKAIAKTDERREAKSLVRKLRKRWSRPTVVRSVNSETGAESTRLVYAEHKYSTARFRISPRKLKMLADQISGKPIQYAILQMQFSHKRAARRIRSTLCLARDHAVAKGMDLPKLVVSQAWVGKGRKYRKMEPKGRGKTGIRESFTSFLSVLLTEGQTWEEQQKKQLEKAKRRIHSIGTGGVVRTNKPIINQHMNRPGWSW